MEFRADPSDPLFQHEYGHYLQSQDVGWSYLTRYAIPSGINNLRCGNSYDGVQRHAAYEVEQDANIRSRAYFGDDGWDYKQNPIFGSGKNYDFDEQYGKYKTRDGLIPHHKWFLPLKAALFTIF
jgi:hypothetical protein